MELNIALKEGFPRRLVGELDLPETAFRELVAAFVDFGKSSSLSKPPPMFPRLVVILMTFTARYDYEGAFWPALCENLNVSEVDQGAWGRAFRSSLRHFRLFVPPEHWMINVFPVLFHSIVPEKSLEDFAVMCRALSDAFDVRALDDSELATAVASATLPVILHRFVTGAESKAVALELIRSVTDDLRLDSPASHETLRGRLLLAARQASEPRTRQFSANTQPLPWRLEFSSGRFGVWLSSSRTFEERPVRLSIGQYQSPIRTKRSFNGWSVDPQLVFFPATFQGGDGVVEADSKHLFQIRITRPPQKPPLIFRSVGEAGVLETSHNGQSGDYAIASGAAVAILDADGSPVQPVEDLPRLRRHDITSTRLYSLKQGDLVLSGENPIFEVRQSTRPQVEMRTRSSWTLLGNRAQIKVVNSRPFIRANSPSSESELVLLKPSKRDPFLRLPFENDVSFRPDVRNLEISKVTIWVGGEPSGASGLEFVVLPLQAQYDSERAAVLVSGSGSLHTTNRVILLDALTAEPLQPSELSAQDGFRFEAAEASFRLAYTGLRPTTWGLHPTSTSSQTLSLGADQILPSTRLYVITEVGSTVRLMFDGKAIETEHSDAFGTAVMELTAAIPIALARDAITLKLLVDEGEYAAILITGVPQVRFDDVALRGRHVVGGLMLDSSLEALQIIWQPYRAPWEPCEDLDCEGSARVWSIDREVPNRRCSLTAIGRIAGREVSVFDGGTQWFYEASAQFDTRSDLDVRLYNLLMSTELNQAVALAPHERCEVIRRCLILLGPNGRGIERASIASASLCSSGPQSHRYR